MHLSGSNIRLIVRPDVPHDIIENTFEGALIRRMVNVLRTKHGYELHSNKGVENAVGNLDELLGLAKESYSRFADAAYPLIEKAIAENECLFLDELGEKLGIEVFDIADVLQELCQMYPERLAHFEIAWCENTNDAIPQFGQLGGGADFITEDGIESINAKTWLDEQRLLLERHRAFKPSSRWGQSGHNAWIALVPHDDWVDIATEEGHQHFEIKKIESSGDRQYSLTYSAADETRYFATAQEAFGAGDMWFKRVTNGLEERLMASLKLSSDEWEMKRVGMLYLRHVDTGRVLSHWEGEWHLIDGDVELASNANHLELVSLARDPSPKIPS
jgi:hypothetical protein